MYMKVHMRCKVDDENKSSDDKLPDVLLDVVERLRIVMISRDEDEDHGWDFADRVCDVGSV